MFLLPLVFYTPETRFGAGASGIVTWRTGKDSSTIRSSSVQFGAAFTANRQLLLYAPFQIFLKKEDYNVYGEIGYYDYNYFFFGIGNEQPKDFRETYYVRYPRLRLNVLKRVYDQLYAGIRYSLDDYRIGKTDSAGQLTLGQITGSGGGVTSGAGLIFRFDNRDNLFYASRGYNAELFVQAEDKWTGSEFNFLKYSLDISTYFQNRYKHVLALNLFTSVITGNPPFNQMSLIGGTRKMRGFYEGRYRDKNISMIQAEYRMHFFWRIGGVVFASTGLVSDKIRNYQLQNLKVSGGAGLRILADKTQKINIRLDAGFTEEGQNYYLTITEAF
ncbi:MAG: BamA/TamA family outer membrane protein [Bacteroidota bacterium]|nr:BamA/TamA family outer membrane protein [Bacteroidota bacterium]